MISIEELYEKISNLLKQFEEEGGLFATLRDLKAELYKLEPLLKEQSARAGKSETAIKSMEAKIENIAKTLNAHDEMGQSGFASVKSKIEDIDKALNAHNEMGVGRFDAIETKLSDIDKALNAHNENAGNRFDAVEEKISKLQNFVAEDLRGHFDAVEKNLKTFATEMLTLKTHFEAFESAQKAITSYFDEHKKREEKAQKRENLIEAQRANNRGVELYHKGAYEAAIKEFVYAVELAPDMVAAHNNLGLVHSQLKQNNEAIQAFKRALALDPEFAPAYNNLGFLYNVNREYAKAIEMFQKSLEKQVDQSVAYTNLGNSYYELKRYKEAVASWEKALEHNPFNEDAKRALEMFHKAPKI